MKFEELHTLEENETQVASFQGFDVLSQEALDFDKILDELGGVGFYNIAHFVNVLTGMVSGAFILYSLYYFEIAPPYLCDIDGTVK